MSVEVLSNVVWIKHSGVEIGLPKEVIVMAYQAVKAKDDCDTGTLDSDDDSSVEPMQILTCPECGLIATATGICGYCGSRCE